MKNYIAEGDVFEVTATADVTPGTAILMSDVLGVAINGGTTGDKISVRVTGVFEIAKATGAVSQGDKLYWDATNKVLTTTATSNTWVGWAYKAALSADATVQFRNKVS